MNAFGHTVRAEWTKLRTVRSWRVALLASGALVVLIALLAATGSVGPGGPVPTAPGGGPVVEDAFRLHSRTLDGDGTITARVGAPAGAGTTAWAKAGLILKDGLDRGAPYAVIWRTSGHGVRFQWDFVHDVAGSADPPADLWLRLTREGDRVTGAESSDGATWHEVGSTTLRGVEGPLTVGLAVTSPMPLRVDRSLGSVSVGGHPTPATATFTDVATTGDVTGAWTSRDVGGPDDGPVERGTTAVDGATVTLTGSGDVAPAGSDPGPVATALAGSVVAILPFLAVAVLFVTSEHRTGLARVTFATTGRRWRVLGAKALVVAVTGFVVGLVAAVVAVALAVPVLRGNGVPVAALSFTDGAVVRALLGTAVVVGLLGATAVGLAALLRRSAPAIAILVLLTVVPQIISSGLPLAAARAILRFTPAAGFAVQSTAVRYDFVDAACLPKAGCLFPVPATGVLVAALWCAAALAAAALVARRRDV